MTAPLDRRKFLRSAVSATAALLAPACSEKPRQPVRVGVFTWPGYEPLFLAKDLGYYDERTVKLDEFPTSSEAMLAFQNGVVDAMVLSLDEAIRLRDMGVPFRVVLVMDYSNGGDVILTRNQFENLAALRGAKVGFEANALGAYILTRALELNGMAMADIQAVSLRADRLEGAFIRGDVDAIVTYEPYRTRMMAKGARQVFDSSSLPGEILDVLIVREDRMEARMPELRKMTDGYFIGVHHLHANPVEAAKTIAPRQGVTPEEVPAMYKVLSHVSRDDNKKLLGLRDDAFLKTLERMSAFMTASGLIAGKVNLAPALDGRLVEGAK